jgi:hypothetical protein
MEIALSRQVFIDPFKRERGMMRALRPGLALGLLLAVAACAPQGTGTGASTNPGSDHSAPAVSTSLPWPTGAPPTRANPASVDPTAVDLRPVAWTRAEAAVGRGLSIYYTAGAPSTCNLLGRVDLAETDTMVTVTVLLGQAPGRTATDPSR